MHDHQLPDFDDPVSFVIDQSEPVGPMPLGVIVASIRSGDRDPDSLVWWAAAPEWIPFSQHSQLVAMLDEASTTTTEVDAVEAAEEVDAGAKLTGLFSAPANPAEAADLLSQPPVEVIESEAASSEMTTQVEAPSAATREMSLAAALAGHLTKSRALSDSGDADSEVVDSDDLGGEPPATEVLAPERQTSDLDGSDDPAPEPQTEPSAGVGSDLDEQFEEMTRRSEQHQRRLGWETRVDEVIFSACVALIAEGGFVATDLVSREADRRVTFEHGEDDQRLSFEMVPLSQMNPAGDHVGRHMSVGISWGGEVVDIDSAFTVVRTLATDEPASTGEIRADIDVESSIVYTKVELIWAASDFVDDDYAIDRDVVRSWIDATVHALEQRWNQLFTRRR